MRAFAGIELRILIDGDFDNLRAVEDDIIEFLEESEIPGVLGLIVVGVAGVPLMLEEERGMPN